MTASDLTLYSAIGLIALGIGVFAGWGLGWIAERILFRRDTRDYTGTDYED